MGRAFGALLPAVALLLAACGEQAAEPAELAHQNKGASARDEIIDCAPGGAAAFAMQCVVERSHESDRLFLTVHHPDGGFRRFEVVADGRGMITADGFEEARTSVSAGMLEVSVASDRYRFPARVRNDAAQ